MSTANSNLSQRLIPDCGRAKSGHDVYKPRSDSVHRVKIDASQATTWRGRMELRLDRYFALSHRGSDLATEFRAGTTAFLAASNNFVVNAHIMEHAGVSTADTVVSGAFCAAVACVCSGLLSNLPLGLVPSVGPNVFLAFSLVARGVVDTDQALAISGACGFSLVMLSVTPVLKVVLGLVPLCIKYGLIMGTGLLSALIGLKSIGVVVPDTGPAHDIVALGTLEDRRVLIAFSFLIIMASMLHRGVKGAVLIGMLGATVCDWIFAGDAPDAFIALRSVKPHALDFSVLLDSYAWVQVSALLLMLLFSISGAVIGSGRMAGLLTQDGAVPGSTAVYIVAGAATMLSAACGTSPIFVSMSASAGIREGGRTGLTSIVMAFWCLLTAFFFSPMASAIPNCAVAPVLILVGVSMVGESREVAWWSMQEALPAFLCAVFQPFTYSVANGIYAGLGMSSVLFFTTGTFLTYLPGHRKHLEEEVQSSVKSSVQDLQAIAMAKTHSQKYILQSLAQHSGAHGGATPGLQEKRPNLSAAKTNPHLPSRNRSQTVLQQRFGFSDHDLNRLEKPHTVSEDLSEADTRTALSRAGRENRLIAMKLIERAAKIVGLDADEIQKVVEERMLGGARNVEGHFIGGIANWESDLIKAVASEGHMAGSPVGSEAPYIAAAARRLRFRHMTCGDVEVMQHSQSEQMDIEAM